MTAIVGFSAFFGLTLMFLGCAVATGLAARRKLHLVSVGCAVASEVIRVIRDDGLLEHSKVMGERLRQGLLEIADASPHVGQVRGRGLLQGVELVTDKGSLTPLAGAASRLTGLAHDRNLMIYSCPTPLHDTVIEAVMLAPPLNLDEADVDEIVNRFGDAVAGLAL